MGFVPYGQAMGAAVAALRAAKERDPLAPVTVVVPSNYAGLSLRARAGTEGPVVNVRFLVLARLAELLGAPRLALGRRPLTAWRRAEAIRAALAREPGMFGGVEHHPATIHALESTFRDLDRAPEGALKALAEHGRQGAEMVRIYERFRRLTANSYDMEDLAEAAAAAVMEDAAPLRDVGRVILYLPRTLSPGEERLLLALMMRGEVDVILGLTGDEQVDTEMRDPAGRLGFRLPDGETTPPAGTAIVKAVDIEEEVRTAIRLIARVLDEGTALHRIGVLMGSPETYAGLLQEQFGAAGIPFHGPPIRPLSQSVAGRVLLGILRLPGTEFRRTDVMEWMNCGPIVESWEGEHAGRWIQAHRWDEISRDAGVVKGLRQWQLRLTTWPQGEHRTESQMQSATRLKEFLEELQQGLAVPGEASMASMAAMGAWALSLLDRYLGSETTAAGWKNDVEVGAYAEVRKLLQSMASAEPPVDPDTGRPVLVLAGLSREQRLQVFVQALERELERPSGRLGPFGEGVFIGPIRAARGMEFDHLYVLGMTEGSVPGVVREDPLLSDDYRETANLPLRADRRIEARGDYLAALATAPTRTLSAPQSSLREQSKELPSRWLLETATALAGGGEEISSEEFEAMWNVPGLTAVASFEDAIQAESLPPASEQEWELRSLQRGRDPLGHFLAEEAAFVAGIEAMTVRLPAWGRRYRLEAGDLSPWAGRVGSGVSIGGDRPTSPTALETLAACPFRYFLKHQIYVKETERPEQIYEIEAKERGSIIHDALERFFVEVQEAGAIPGPDTNWSPEQRRRLLAIGEELCARAHDRGVTGGELRWQVDRARIRRDLTLFLDKDNERRRETRATFAGAELAFGELDEDGVPRGGSLPPLVVDMPGGGQVWFRGRIDRVDRREDGGLIVYDYKTGGSRDYEKVREGDRLMAGKRLQLPLYGLAARREMADSSTPIEAYYWFVSERGGFEAIGYPLTPEVDERLTEVLGALSRTVEAGMFPQVPGGTTRDGRKNRETNENCKYCPFDRVCPGGDRKARWEEWRQAPGLAPYVALVGGAPATEDVEADDVE